MAASGKIARTGHRARMAGGAVLLMLAAVAARADPITLYVGSGGGEFASLSSAVASATAGYNAANTYTIDIDPGTYLNSATIVNIPLTIQNDNPTAGAVVLNDSADQGATPTYAIPNLKGILVTNAAVTVNGLTFEGAAVPVADGGNGAGIRAQAGNLSVYNSSFIDDQDGILTNPDAAMNVLIDNSVFDGNGNATGPDAGFTHAIYVGEDASLTVEDSTFNGTQAGHDIKSRAASTTIADNYLDDGVTGTASYAIDVPNGGVATIEGNTIVQGTNTQNPAMIAYDAEHLAYTDNSLLVKDNSFTNYLPGLAIGVDNYSGGNGDPPVYAQLTGNTFTDLSGDSPSTFQPVTRPVSTPEPSTFVLLAGALLLWPATRLRRSGTD
ncbi:MAG TPA: right-handed parallel beta-helix repeat-containing protein [Acetobacteraceae bacterium]